MCHQDFLMCVSLHSLSEPRSFQVLLLILAQNFLSGTFDAKFIDFFLVFTMEVLLKTIIRQARKFIIVFLSKK